MIHQLLHSSVLVRGWPACTMSLLDTVSCPGSSCHVDLSTRLQAFGSVSVFPKEEPWWLNGPRGAKLLKFSVGTFKNGTDSGSNTCLQVTTHMHAQ
jgi:hypothetical protein